MIHKERERRDGINLSSKERFNVARRMLNDEEFSFEDEDSGRKDGKSKDEWSFSYGSKLDGESKHLSNQDIFVKEVTATKLKIVKKWRDAITS